MGWIEQVTSCLTFINFALHSLLRQGHSTLMADKRDQMHHFTMLACAAQRLAIDGLTAQNLALFGLDASLICILLVNLSGIGTHAPFQFFNRYFRQHPMQSGNAGYALPTRLQTSEQLRCLFARPLRHPPYT